MTSEFSIVECLGTPVILDDAELSALYRTFFHMEYVTLLPVTRAICEQAADLRARYGFKSPDALHLASAIVHDCECFVTRDARLARCSEARVQLIAG